MLFHRQNFEHVLTEDQATLVAKLANEVVDRQAKVLYGRLYSNGKAEDFTTGKKRTDTHVCLGVAISEMGAFSPSEAPIAIARPEANDLVRAQAERLKILENENRQLRELNK